MMCCALERRSTQPPIQLSRAVSSKRHELLQYFVCTEQRQRTRLRAQGKKKTTKKRQQKRQQKRQKKKKTKKRQKKNKKKTKKLDKKKTKKKTKQKTKKKREKSGKNRNERKKARKRGGGRYPGRPNIERDDTGTGKIKTKTKTETDNQQHKADDNNIQPASRAATILLVYTSPTISGRRESQAGNQTFCVVDTTQHNTKSPC